MTARAACGVRDTNASAKSAASCSMHLKNSTTRVLPLFAGDSSLESVSKEYFA